MAAAKAGDAVGGGAAGGIGGPAEDRRDLGVGQAAEVVVRDGLFLFGRQLHERVREVRVELLVRRDRGRVGKRPRVGTARRAATRVTSMALRCAIVTSHASTLASAGRSGYAFIAARNASDHASSASTGPRTARQTRSTVGPCLETTVSNGGLGHVSSILTLGRRRPPPKREFERETTTKDWPRARSRQARRGPARRPRGRGAGGGRSRSGRCRSTRTARARATRDPRSAAAKAWW